MHNPRLIDEDESSNFISYWSHKPLKVGKRVTHSLDGVDYKCVVVECEWDDDYRPPQYEVTLEVLGGFID